MLDTKMSALLLTLVATAAALHRETSADALEKASTKVERKPGCECINWNTAYVSHLNKNCDLMGDWLCKDFFMKFEDNSCVSEYGAAVFRANTSQFCLVDSHCNEPGLEQDGRILATRPNWLRKKWCNSTTESMLNNKTFAELVKDAEKWHLDLSTLVRMAYPTMVAEAKDYKKFYKTKRTDLKELAELKAKAKKTIESENFVLVVVETQPDVSEYPLFVVTKCGDYQISVNDTHLDFNVANGSDPYETAELMNVVTPVKGTKVDTPECEL